jgi:hypothetical protein
VSTTTFTTFTTYSPRTARPAATGAPSDRTGGRVTWKRGLATGVPAITIPRLARG